MKQLPSKTRPTKRIDTTQAEPTLRGSNAELEQLNWSISLSRRMIDATVKKSQARMALAAAENAEYLENDPDVALSVAKDTMDARTALAKAECDIDALQVEMATRQLDTMIATRKQIADELGIVIDETYERENAAR